MEEEVNKMLDAFCALKKVPFIDTVDLAFGIRNLVNEYVSQTLQEIRKEIEGKKNRVMPMQTGLMVGSEEWVKQEKEKSELKGYGDAIDKVLQVIDKHI